jgi:hypothetical protein
MTFLVVFMAIISFENAGLLHLFSALEKVILALRT